MRRSRSGVNGVALTAAVAVPLVYLTWRLGWTLGGPWWMSTPLLAAEAVLIVRYVLGLITTAVAPTPVSDPASVCRAGDGPEVELLVPAGLADRDELTRTLLVASVSGATRIRVLDHRVRPRIRRTARRLGAEYEVHEVTVGSRPAALVDAARAGARSEVLAWVDAGDVVVPGFLDLASMLVDPARPRLAVVQSSIDLINADSLLHLSPDRDERALQNEVVGPSLSRSGAAEWLGSGSLFRADAVAAIGGLPDEGAPTHRAAMRLARAGWAVRWSTPPAVRTEAPDSLDAYLFAAGTAAHEDWALLGGGDSPLRPGRTGLRRRAAQLHASTAVLDGLARLTAFAVLVATLVTGELPVGGSLLAVALAFCVQLALRTATSISLGRGAIGLGDTTRHGLRTMGVHVLGLWRRPRYPVTAHKGGLATLGRLRLATSVLVAVDLALLARVATFFAPDLLPGFGTDGGRFLAMAAAVWSIVALVDVLHLLVGRVQRRSTHRQVTDLVAEVDGRPCKVVDLSPRGIGLLVAERPDPGVAPGSVTAGLRIPRLDGTAAELAVRLRFRHVADEPDATSGRYRAGATFVGLDDRSRDVLTEYCALTAEQRDVGRDRVATTAPDDLAVGGPGPGRRALAVANVAAVLVAGLVVAAAPAGAAPVPGSGGGTLTGRVVAPDGQPVVGACVQSSGPVDTAANTDAQGQFDLGGLADGTYQVVASDCGRNEYAPTFAPSVVVRSEAATFTIAGGDVPVGDIRLRELAELTGTVTDARGLPLDDICASFVFGPSDDQQWQQVGRTDALGRFAGKVPADVDGVVHLHDCAATPRVVDAWFPNADQAADADVVNVAAGSAVDLGSTALSDGAVVQGVVTDTAGVPQEHVCVSAQDVAGMNWVYRGGASTDAGGHFEFLTAPGTYAIWMDDCDSGSDLVSQWYASTPSSADPIPTVEVGRGGATLNDAMRRGGRASGVLLDRQGRPADGVCVTLHDATDPEGGDATWNQVQPDGTWLSSPVGAGDYLVLYTSCDGSEWIDQIRSGVFPNVGQPWSFADVDPIRIQVGQTTAGVDDVAVRGAVVSGTVRSGGSPVADVCVGGIDGSDSVTSTGGDGRWHARTLPDADVTLTFTDCSPGRGLVQQRQTVRVADGGDLDVDVDMTTGGTSSVVGSVRNGAGTGPAGSTCAVAFVPDHLIGAALVDADGSFRIDGLADGDYWFGFFGCGDDDRDAAPVRFDGDATEYPPTWYPATPIRMGQGSPQPESDGVPVVEVRAGRAIAPLDMCFGVGCEATTTVPSTTVAPADDPATATGPTPTPFPPAPAPGSGTPRADRLTSPSPATRGRRLPRTSLRPPAASAATVTGTSSGDTTTTTTEPTVAGTRAAAATTVATIAPVDAAGIVATGDEVAAVEPLKIVPPDRQGFPWDLLGGTVLVAAAAIALIVVWHRRHPAMG